eukprot:2450012-Amphidinium_carterae.1
MHRDSTASFQDSGSLLSFHAERDIAAGEEVHTMPCKLKLISTRAANRQPPDNPCRNIAKRVGMLFATRAGALWLLNGGFVEPDNPFDAILVINCCKSTAINVTLSCRMQ